MTRAMEHCDDTVMEHCDEKNSGALVRKGSWEIVKTIEKCDENGQQAK